MTSCFEWLELLFSRLGGPSANCGRDLFESVPDDVIVSILCRLPTHQVLRCQAVCKRWRWLLTRPHFIRLHQDKGSASSGIVLHSRCHFHKVGKVEVDLLYLYKFPEKTKWKNMLRLTRLSTPSVTSIGPFAPKLCASCNGFLVFQTSSHPVLVHLICNPVTKERMTLTNLTGMLGFFYNPSTRKYWFLCIKEAANNLFLYYIRHIRKRSSPREIGTFSSAPHIDDAPALSLDGYLYWLARWQTPCARCIIAFEVDTERLLFMPHPGPPCLDMNKHRHMFVLGMDGQLCFAHVSRRSMTIEIWVLKDLTNREWVKCFNLDLQWIARWNPFRDVLPASGYWMQPLAIRGQELVLAWSSMGIVKCHLQHQRISVIGSIWSKMTDMYTAGRWLYSETLPTTTSKMTFAPLRDLQ